MRALKRGRREVIRARAVVRLGVVGAAAVWLGCNAIIGLEQPVHDLCADVTCNAADACHEAGECDPATGACPLAPDGTACDDGNACTQTDTCQDGACAGASPVICTPVDACHEAGTCDPATGACNIQNVINGMTCDDSDCSTQGDTCQAGVCNPGGNHIWAHWVPDVPKNYGVTDDVVVDTTTGRTWQRQVAATSYRWQAAKDYCGTLSLPGYPSGWRLPTRIELVSIVDYTKNNPAVDTVVFPGTPSDAFWSSSLSAGDSSGAWGVTFNVGYVGADVVDNTFRVRCVR